MARLRTAARRAGALIWARRAEFSAISSSYPLPSIAVGLDAGPTWPTASEYFRYVSIDATTLRASTVIRSIPTRETRTHASMTIPLSRTRSRTSIRLVPPAARSTGIGYSCESYQALSERPGSGSTARKRRQPALQHSDFSLQFLILG